MTPTTRPTMELKHKMNCAAEIPGNENSCTCGLRWRIELQTEREMHTAWRKRAEEAEVALAAMSRTTHAGEGMVELKFVSGDLPPVEVGKMRLFVVAGLSPEGQKTCFPAYYLNAYPLEYDDCVCKSEEEHSDDGCPTTGWFYDESNFEYENCYHPIRGTVIAWAEWPNRELVHAVLSPSKPAPVVVDKDDTPANVDRMDERGFVTWASSEEGGGPDVGITVGLGADLGHLWLGDITRQRWEEVGGPDFSDNDMGWWLIHYAPGKEPDVLGKILEPDHEPAREFLEHILAPLLATSPNRPQATERARSSTVEPSAHNGLVSGSNPDERTTPHSLTEADNG